MTAQMKVIVSRYLVPLIFCAMAVGAAQLSLSQKEDKSQHDLDIQRVEAKHKADLMYMTEKDNQQMELLLDVLCAVKPRDRRCL